MAGKNHRPADTPTCRWYGSDKSVATAAMQDALWSLAASEPERFVQGLQDGKVAYLADLPWWFDFKHSPALRFQAELIIVLAADNGIAERPAKSHPTPGYLNRR